MSMHDDLSAFWSDLSSDAPSGADLEYDSGFMALERAATIRSERAVGDSVIAAEAPDWERVRDQALAIAGQTRDLRVAVHLMHAWLQLEGMEGAARGLALIHGLLDNHWQTVHPQLDAEDDDDPTARVNVLSGLADPQGLLASLRTVPFVSSPRLGRFSLRDLRIAEGTLKRAADSEAPDVTRMELEACCRDCQEEALERTAGAISEALARARAIESLLSERLGYQAPDLKALISDLAELEHFIQPQWQLRSGATSSVEGGVDGVASHGGTASAAGGIQGLEDVRRRIDEICDFYARNEPSSPVPLMLRRARRLVGCDFLSLLKDLAPGGLDELERVVGREEDSDSDD